MFGRKGGEQHSGKFLGINFLEKNVILTKQKLEALGTL